MEMSYLKMNGYIKYLFVDTGFWIALIDQRDQNHTIAKQSLKPLLNNYNICLSDFIIFETLTYLNCSLKRHDLAIHLIRQKAPESVFLQLMKQQKIKRFSGS